MIVLVALSLVVIGAALLVAALVPVRKLVAQLPPGGVRQRWRALRALIVLFVLGYAGYAIAFWRVQAVLADLIVPLVFFGGGCFVWLIAQLSLRTATDMMRVSVLEREVLTDPLTAAFNRRYLERRLGEEVARARRYGFALSVFMIDIDHFKQVNDRFGHQVGDRVLVGTAGIVTEMLRSSDMLTRYGGEEFIVVAPHTDLAGAAQLAERVRERMEGHDFGWFGAPEAGRSIGITVSAGVAALSDGVDDAQKLIAQADRNLYLAKQRGRNRVVADV